MTDKQKRLAVLQRKIKRIERKTEAVRLAWKHFKAIANAFDIRLTPIKRG